MSQPTVVDSGIWVDPAEIGNPTSESVVLEIDYAIIRHFSEHLYGSPNRAVEELVANSYDALARNTYVYLPGQKTDGRLIVWDDGRSMGIDELKSSWQIAKSPKNDGGQRMATDGQLRRKMIGKFGIGKLASYTLGGRITYYCRIDSDYFVVTIDYGEVHHGLGSGEQLDEILEGGEEVATRYATPIRRLTKSEVRGHVEGLFKAGSSLAIREALDKERWTIAVVDKLRDPLDLSPGRVSWVLGNGMPLRPDFALYVDDLAVESKLGAGATTEWTLEQRELQRAVEISWAEASRNQPLSGQPLMPGQLIPADWDKSDLIDEDSADAEAWNRVPDDVIIFPSLGPVRAKVRLFRKSLQRKKGDDRPRSHGFFVMVRGRLLNPEDDRLTLHDPSFAYFYRAQFVLDASRLDEDLLADRGRIRQGTERVAELAILQQALYRAARAELERQDLDATTAATTESLLPVESRELFREPLTALIANTEGIEPGDFDLGKPTVQRKDLSEAGPVSDLDPDGLGFRVNNAHPFYRSVKDKAGSGRKAAEIMRIFDLFAVAERLLEGYLYDLGLPREQVEGIVDWRDRLFRTLAGRYAIAVDEVIQEVRSSSYQGRVPFEKALAKLFNLMGFVPIWDGASGKKDILVVAPVGPGHHRFTVEAKGSKHAVENDATDLDIAAAHRTDSGATHSIVVAREFKGFASTRSSGERPMVLKQLAELDNVSIVSVETLVSLFEAIHRYSYPLELVLPVLMEVESPEDKLARVNSLGDPLSSFDTRAVLDEIWLQQNGQAAGDVVSVRALWQSKPEWRPALSLEDFKAKLAALETLSDGLLQFKADSMDVFIRQAPEFVVARIERSLEVHQALDEVLES